MSPGAGGGMKSRSAGGAGAEPAAEPAATAFARFRSTRCRGRTSEDAMLETMRDTADGALKIAVSPIVTVMPTRTQDGIRVVLITEYGYSLP